MKPVSFENVSIVDGFWQKRISTAGEKTVWACIEECERTHRIDNFRRAAGLQEGGFTGIFFDDSDVYKVLEGVAYTLENSPSEALEKKADEIIDAICAAQQEDGYLYTYFILNTPENRWTDMNYHEAYCLGHMIEGAVAYARATGKEKWLNAAKRAVEQMMSVNGKNGAHWVTGHEEIELALVKLYRYTGDKKYIEYAQWLVEERGHGHLNTPLSENKELLQPVYCQDDVPVREISRVTGHAVRAMYYYSGVTDLASLLNDDDYANAMKRVWKNVVPANMYVTGGIGQSSHNEGFTADWSLPNLTAYCETCASIGMALWNHRMNLLTGESKYADIVEMEMYNGILAGISLSGDKFFYENPLSSIGNHHRRTWYGCSCCPTNLVRFIPSVGGYAYCTDGDVITVNQFISSNAKIKTESGEVTLIVKTEYPFAGDIHIVVKDFEGERTLRLRQPGWCKSIKLTKNGKEIEISNNGYCEVTVKANDEIDYILDISPRRIYADARVREDAGRVAVAAGPLIYCAEETDNAGIPTEYFHADMALAKGTVLQPQKEEILNGVTTFVGKNIKLIPYYAWDNREAGGMSVWLKEV